MRVLIVDDSRVDSMLLQRALRRGAETRVAHTAADARLLAEEWESDCVLLDYCLPDADGIELIPFFTELGIPVVMITASGDEELDRAVMKAGAEDYLQKGRGDGDLLLRTVQHAVERHSAKQLFQSVVDSSPVGMLIVSEKKEVIFASLRVCDMFQTQREELLGSPISKFFAPGGGPSQADIEQLLDQASTGDSRGLLTARVSDGCGVPVEVQVTRVKKRGAPHLLLNVTDVSERLELENHLHQVQKMEAVGRVAGGVAHDFNNQLTTIMSYGEMVQEALEPKSVSALDMKVLLEAVDTAAILTRQLLAFSRQQIVQPTRQSIASMLEATSRLTSRVLGEDMHFELELSGADWEVLMDPHAFEQVIVNLAVNARDAMKSGGTLTLRTRSHSVSEAVQPGGCAEIPPGDYVVLEVEDTGAGVDPCARNSIFEPFYSTKHTGRGGGLGLSTCLGIVEQAGGFLWLDSEAKEGARFVMYLPRAVLAQGEERAEPDAMSGTECVLVVEDDEGISALLSRVLTKQGYRVVTADSEESAMRHVSDEDSVDLLLSDVVLREGNGRELAERFHMQSPGTKTLLMSGYTADILGTHGVDVVGTPLLLKPFSPQQVVRRVRELLDQTQ